MVDSYPTGMFEELVEPMRRSASLRVLVQRHLTAQYAEETQVQRHMGLFDEVINPAETGPMSLRGGVTWTSAWLSREPAELLSRADARRQLDIEEGDHRKVVVVYASGRPAEIDAFSTLAEALHSQLDAVGALGSAGTVQDFRCIGVVAAGRAVAGGRRARLRRLVSAGRRGPGAVRSTGGHSVPTPLRRPAGPTAPR